ncbi:MAG TPA: DUF4337 domain-containing protein [Xanthobacteraceae bacterium]|jgi:hypothetical protein|nr:DUF4337 domain-containing protein [Xanthobacteraceae bacterium]
MSAHEAHERAEHAEEAGHHNKGIALLIAVLALFLALSETLGKAAQTGALTDTVQSSDTWAFYQARNIRATTVGTQKEVLELQAAAVTDPAQKEALTKKIADWEKRIKRWESDPEKREGMKELMAKAQGLEKKRDYQLEQYHNYEIASAALQIAIVLASASIITSMTILAWLSGGGGILGVVFMAFGFWAPDVLMHLFAGGHAAGH